MILNAMKTYLITENKDKIINIHIDSDLQCQTFCKYIYFPIV